MTALGQVVGVLLDRSASTESGTARLVHHGQDEQPVEHRLAWRSIDVWRWQSADGRAVCDGVAVHSKSRRAAASEPMPIRRGWPAWYLQLVFPLRAHVWGRLGDDYYLADAADEGQLVRVSLAGTEDDRVGSLLVDPTSGYIHEAVYNRTRLELRDLETGPQPDALFTP